MSKKDKKTVENVVENEINDVENETWTTDADENESVENQTQPDETMPENDEQKDEEENATDESVETWTENDDENVMKTTDGTDNEENHDNVENVVENEKWLIHVKAIYNWGSIDKGCEYWIEKKFYEEKKYLFEVLED